MANETTTAPVQNGRLNSHPQVHIGLSNDFKSAMCWALLGVVGGVILGIWMTKQFK